MGLVHGALRKRWKGGSTASSVAKGGSKKGGGFHSTLSAKANPKKAASEAAERKKRKTRKVAAKTHKQGQKAATKAFLKANPRKKSGGRIAQALIKGNS